MLLKLIIMTAVFLSIADPSAKVFVQQSSEPISVFYSNNRSSRVQAITRMVALVGLLIFSNSGRLAAQTLTYAANAAAFNNTIFLNTPITADTNGVIFFGFRVQQTAPAPLNTTNGGFARLDASGNSNYVLAGDAAADARISRDSHNCAPALSN